MRHRPVGQAGITIACIFLFSLGSPSLSAQPRTQALATFIASALKTNPQIQAAAARVDAQVARSRGAARPLFNPGLEFEYENSDVDLATLELSQTLDWHDKRSAYREVAEAELDAERAALFALRERLAGTLLVALADRERTAKLEALAAERVTLMERFVRLHNQRAAAGDIGQTELQLARLALAQARLQYTEAATDRVESQTVLRHLLGNLPDTLPKLPGELPKPVPKNPDLEALAAQHPAVREARLRSLAAQRTIQRTDRARRADPTIGIKGGIEDRNTLIGFRLEIPWQIRNDFSEQVESAKAQAFAEAQDAQDAYRQVLAQLRGAYQRSILTRRALQRWRTQGQSHLRGYTDVLERLWQAGEIGTTEYLVQLQQALDTRIEGEAVWGRAWRAWADWLSASGQVQRWLGIEEKTGRQL